MSRKAGIVIDMFQVQGLYAVTNGPRVDLLEAVAAALTGGARLVQYRDKTTDGRRRLSEALMLGELCRSHDAPLIINDDVQLAIDCGAAGVHLGADDVDLRAARSRLGETAIIGASCYDSLDRARHAVEDGADYVAFGAFYSSSTKPLARHADTDLLSAAKSMGVPVIAIGGITPENAPRLIDAGADGVAVISSLFDASDIESVARRLSQLFP